MFNLFRDKFSPTGSSNTPSISVEALAVCSLIKDLIKEKFSSSFRVYIFDSGSCNGCELELQLLFSPLYNLSSYGVTVSYDVSKADVIFITGLMTENMYAQLESAYGGVKESKGIIMIGDCPVYRTAFRDTFALKDKVSNLFPKAFHISGCPPEPLVFLEGLYEYLKKI